MVRDNLPGGNKFCVKYNISLDDGNIGTSNLLNGFLVSKDN